MATLPPRTPSSKARIFCGSMLVRLAPWPARCSAPGGETVYGSAAMPLPLAPFAAALLGVVFGLVGRDEVRRTSAPPSATRGFLVVALVSILLLAPALGYFVAFYPDWAYA